MLVARKACKDRVWIIQRSGSTYSSPGMSNCSENVSVESSTQILSTYVVYKSTEDQTVSDMIAPVMEPHTNRSGYQRVHLSVGVNGHGTTPVTHLSEAIVRQPVTVVRTCQPTAGAERSTHQDAPEPTTRPPSDCIFTVSFCQGNLWRQLTIPYPHRIQARSLVSGSLQMRMR
jgi:hypothetical protein